MRKLEIWNRQMTKILGYVYVEWNAYEGYWYPFTQETLYKIEPIHVSY